MVTPTRARRTKTARELAKRFNVTERTIRNTVAEAREDFLARANERRTKILELWNQGWTQTAISEEIGYPLSMVSLRIKEARENDPTIRKPKPGRPKKITNDVLKR